MRKALLKPNGKKRVLDTARQALGVLKAFTLTLPDGSSLHIDVDAVSGTPDSGDLAGLFGEIDRAPNAHGSGG